MPGPKPSSAPVGAAPADSPTTAGSHGVQPDAARASAPPLEPLASGPLASEAAGQALLQAKTASPAQTRTHAEAHTLSRRPSPAPLEPLSAYEEEMLRAYSRTLAGTYERWKEEGDDMPLVLAVMLRQWRSAGCPAERVADTAENLNSTDSPNSADSTPSPTEHSEENSFASPLYDCRSDCCNDCPARGQHAPAADTTGAPALATGDVATATTGGSANNATGATGTAGTAGSASPKVGAVNQPARAAAKSPLLRESKPRAEKTDKKSDGNAQMSLPGVAVPRTPGETAPMSNYLARTSLFAPIRKGRRVMHDKQMLHSPEGIDVLYTGKQLDMADQDVYLTALRLAGGIKAGDRILINRAAFLRMLGYKHNPGARDYKWLEESFYRISTGRVIIKAKHIEANLPLMGALLTDTRSGDYYFTIPRETYALWAKNLYSYIDLEKRHALERNVPLSKWLQSYAQSHAPGTHTISMDLLHLWCGYGGRLRDFRDSLTGALEELTRVGILTSWAVQERGKGRQKKIMISWVRERTHRDDAPPPLLEE